MSITPPTRRDVELRGARTGTIKVCGPEQEARFSELPFAPAANADLIAAFLADSLDYTTYAHLLIKLMLIHREWNDDNMDEMQRNILRLAASVLRATTSMPPDVQQPPRIEPNRP